MEQLAYLANEYTNNREKNIGSTDALQIQIRLRFSDIWNGKTPECWHDFILKFHADLQEKSNRREEESRRRRNLEQYTRDVKTLEEKRMKVTGSLREYDEIYVEIDGQQRTIRGADCKQSMASSDVQIRSLYGAVLRVAGFAQ